MVFDPLNPSDQSLALGSRQLGWACVSVQATNQLQKQLPTQTISLGCVFYPPTAVHVELDLSKTRLRDHRHITLTLPYPHEVACFQFKRSSFVKCEQSLTLIDDMPQETTLVKLSGAKALTGAVSAIIGTLKDAYPTSSMSGWELRTRNSSSVSERWRYARQRCKRSILVTMGVIQLGLQVSESQFSTTLCVMLQVSCRRCSLSYTSIVGIATSEHSVYVRRSKRRRMPCFMKSSLGNRQWGAADFKATNVSIRTTRKCKENQDLWAPISAPNGSLA